MNLLEKIKARFAREAKPEHLRRGDLGERAAEKFLKGQGMKFLTRNFRSARGEIDLIFRDADCLIFVPNGKPAFQAMNSASSSNTLMCWGSDGRG